MFWSPINNLTTINFINIFRPHVDNIIVKYQITNGAQFVVDHFKQ